MSDWQPFTGNCLLLDDYTQDRLARWVKEPMVLSVRRFKSALLSPEDKAYDKDHKLVALKVLDHCTTNEGMSVNTLREIHILSSVHHENIVKFLGVAVGPNYKDIALVFEYVEHDLVAMSNTIFTVPEIKCLMKQLLSSVAHLHERNIIHRDIKMTNLMYNNSGQLKLSDLGLGRYARDGDMSPGVATLCYRAPELLLGQTHYTKAIDVWSCGCVMGELLLGGEMLFPGSNQLEQFELICALLGTPNEKSWPGYDKLPYASKLKLPFCQSTLQSKFTFVDKACLDLLSRLLEYDPEQRITASEALDHPWFSSLPLAKLPQYMPTFQEDTKAYLRRHKKMILNE